MKTLLQINTDSNWGSTGKIVEAIGLSAECNGWRCIVAYGRDHNPSKLTTIKIGTRLNPYIHYFCNKLFDAEGKMSVCATRRLIRKIEKIHPDVVQLHNLHDHYLNYGILFGYLEKHDIPVVWTQHDCWAYTGGCCHYSMAECDKWKIECDKCKQRRGLLADNTLRQFREKKQVFSEIHNLTIVPVSEWLATELSKSFLGTFPIQIIPNGVDINVFKPIPKTNARIKFNLGDGPVFLGVASTWSDRKGLKDYTKLAELLKEDERIVLVGLSKAQESGLPSNIIGIPRTQNVEDLVELYNEASIVLNLSYEETFGLTTVEGFACGTPGIVYNCTASPELITPETGRVVEGGDIEGVNRAIQELLTIGKSSMSVACRQRAIEKYDKGKCYKKYVELYEYLMNK